MGRGRWWGGERSGWVKEEDMAAGGCSGWRWHGGRLNEVLRLDYMGFLHGDGD